MVILLSNETDLSTCDVIDWLHFYKKKFIRINDCDELILKDMLIDDSPSMSLLINNKECHTFNSNSISYWFRRGEVNIGFDKHKINKPENSSILNHIKYEYKHLSNGITSFLETRKRIGSSKTADINKIEILLSALKVGLQIPPTIVTNQKNALIDFYIKHKKIITKGIQEVFKSINNGIFYGCYTEQMCDKAINELPDQFPYSFFQKEIDKKYEIRVFYINKQCYSMAIFSQRDSQTSVDFRKYNKSKPNRITPYQLPNIIKKKIIKLMVMNKLETGSLDLIYSKNSEYIFLEINPIGQFGMVSGPCNYYLERKIAKSLIS